MLHRHDRHDHDHRLSNMAGTQMMAPPRHLAIVEPAPDTVMPPSAFIALCAEYAQAVDDAKPHMPMNGDRETELVRYAKASKRFCELQPRVLAAVTQIGRANQ